MKQSIKFILLVGTIALLGAGCISLTPSTEERLAMYESERDQCISQERNSFDLTYNGQPASWDGYQQNKAEYKCSTVDLAQKYYDEDPEGIIELCVRTKQISNYTAESGLGGGYTQTELDRAHELGLAEGIAMDESGTILIDDETIENWRWFCKTVIENVLDVK